MQTLNLPRKIYEEMLLHCRECSPNEACGILAGRGGSVERLYRMTNIEQSPVSYLMDSGEQFRVMKDMRERGLSMIGIYHSHPASGAFPSQKDRELAFYEDAVYIIVSLAEGAPVINGFSFKDGTVENVRIVVL